MKKVKVVLLSSVVFHFCDCSRFGIQCLNRTRWGWKYSQKWNKNSNSDKCSLWIAVETKFKSILLNIKWWWWWTYEQETPCLFLLMPSSQNAPWMPPLPQIIPQIRRLLVERRRKDSPGKYIGGHVFYCFSSRICTPLKFAEKWLISMVTPVTIRRKGADAVHQIYQYKWARDPHCNHQSARARSASAITGRQHSRSGVGEDFLMRRPFSLLRKLPFLGNEKSKNWSKGAKSTVSPRATNGPLTKSRVL